MGFAALNPSYALRIPGPPPHAHWYPARLSSRRARAESWVFRL